MLLLFVFVAWFIVISSFIPNASAILQNAGLDHNGLGQSPRHVKLYFTGDSSERVVCWATNSKHKTILSIVRYGQVHDDLSQIATGTYTHFHHKAYSSFIHCVLLTDLRLESQYYYIVGDPKRGERGPFSFRTKNACLRYAIYGDFGLYNEVSLDTIISEAQTNAFDAVLHLGDYAYDLHDHHGHKGDQFEDSIEPITSRVPYMTVTGNHEKAGNFSHYVNRFRGAAFGAGDKSGSNTNRWYSFNVDLTHFVVVDTELYSYYVDAGQTSRQLRWLEEDLRKAHKNRGKQPWIITLGHKCSWMPEVSENFVMLAELFVKYGVDMHFCGHQHNYNRAFPFHLDHRPEYAHNMYKNPVYYTQIVSGSPGCENGVAVKHAPDNVLASGIDQYGYGHLTVFNRTHIYWDWMTVSDSLIQDHLWIIKD